MYGKLRVVVQPDEVGFDLSCPHEMNAGQQHSIHVQQRFDMWRVGLLKQLPLRLGKSEVMMGMMLGDAVGGDRLQFLMLRRCQDDQRRQQLLQHIAVLLQHQAKELPGVVRHEVDFQTIMNAGLLDRLLAVSQSQRHLFSGSR